MKQNNLPKRTGESWEMSVEKYTVMVLLIYGYIHYYVKVNNILYVF